MAIDLLSPLVESLNFWHRLRLGLGFLRPICLAAFLSSKVELLLPPLGGLELGLNLLKRFLDRKRRCRAMMVHYLIQSCGVRRPLRRLRLAVIRFLGFVLRWLFLLFLVAATAHQLA